MLNLSIARVARQRRRRRQQQGMTAPRFLRWLVAGVVAVLVLIAGLVLLGMGAFVAVYNHYAAELPPAEDIIAAEEEAFLTTVLYDRTGQTVIYEVMDPLGGDRRWVSTSSIPRYFLDATVAIEDASFYENPGFDLRGVARALWNNLTGGYVQGASTISQQLVRNVLMDPEERRQITLDRKIK